MGIRRVEGGWRSIRSTLGYLCKDFGLSQITRPLLCVPPHDGRREQRMTERMTKIVYIEPKGNKREIEVKEGWSVMEGAVACVEGIVAECGGTCSCATCHVYVDEATYAKLPPPDDIERAMLERRRRAQADQPPELPAPVSQVFRNRSADSRPAILMGGPPGTSIVIVGASHAGAQLADSLRREHSDGGIVMIGDEPELPYHRPPLSKEYLAGKLDDDRLPIRDQPSTQSAGSTCCSGRRVIAIDCGTREVAVDDGSRIAFCRARNGYRRTASVAECSRRAPRRRLRVAVGRGCSGDPGSFARGRACSGHRRRFHRPSNAPPLCADWASR